VATNVATPWVFFQDHGFSSDLGIWVSSKKTLGFLKVLGFLLGFFKFDRKEIFTSGFCPKVRN